MSIATFKPKIRSFTPDEIGTLFRAMNNVSTLPTLKLAVKLIFITMIRKSEFTLATWKEVDFRKSTWSIPAGRDYVIYLPKQVLDLMVGLQMCVCGRECLLPSRYNIWKPLSNFSLNSVVDRALEVANRDSE